MMNVFRVIGNHITNMIKYWHDLISHPKPVVRHCLICSKQLTNSDTVISFMYGNEGEVDGMVVVCESCYEKTIDMPKTNDSI